MNVEKHTKGAAPGEEQMNGCDHKCHTTGLNPWVESCPVCGCANPEFDPAIQAPTNMAELLAFELPSLLGQKRTSTVITYAICHQHEYGSTMYLFQKPGPDTPLTEQDIEQITERLQINYEPDKGETLEIGSVDLNAIPVVELESNAPSTGDSD